MLVYVPENENYHLSEAEVSTENILIRDVL
jgi:hypothetical protein